MAVTGIEVIIIYTQKPEEGIVHYRIGVAGYGIFATKQINGTSYGRAIEEKVVIHQITLDGITTPNPTVAFDSVNKKLACGKVHGISAHFPNAVHFFVIAAERSTIVYWCILVVHSYVLHTDTFIGNNVNVAKSLTVAECIAVGCRKLNSVQSFTMLGIQCFFRTFAIIDIHRTVSFQLFQYKITECLAPEIVKYAISFPF